MKRAIITCLVFIALTAMHSFAEEPAVPPQPGSPGETATDATADVTQPLIPERELKFEVSEEEHPIRLFLADPKLLDLRYVAVVRLELPEDSGSYRRELPNQLDQLCLAASQGIFVGSYLRSRTKEWRVFPSLIDNMPKERQLPKDIASMFVDPAESGRFLASRDVAIEGKAYLEIQVRVPTVERAKPLVLGLLSLYDYGLSYPIQQGFVRLKRDGQKPLVEDRTTLEREKKDISGCEEQLQGLKEFGDINQEALVNFTTQLRLISVDLAGINARIEACNKILASTSEKRLPSSRIDQVETVKITAEIELVGAEARKAAIREIVENGRRRVNLLRSVDTLRAQVRNRESRISQTERRLGQYEAARKLYMPFPVQDGKVTIYPIKWEPAGR